MIRFWLDFDISYGFILTISRNWWMLNALCFYTHKALPIAWLLQWLVCHNYQL